VVRRFCGGEAGGGFLGCGHFSAANRYLEQYGQVPIDWRLPPRDQLAL